MVILSLWLDCARRFASHREVHHTRLALEWGPSLPGAVSRITGRRCTTRQARVLSGEKPGQVKSLI